MFPEVLLVDIVAGPLLQVVVVVFGTELLVEGPCGPRADPGSTKHVCGDRKSYSLVAGCWLVCCLSLSSSMSHGW